MCVGIGEADAITGKIRARSAPGGVLAGPPRRAVFDALVVTPSTLISQSGFTS